VIERATNDDKKAILDKLSKEISKNIYLYIDIYKYGVNSDFIKVWVQRKNNDINLVVMKYYDSFQLYATDDVTDYTSAIDLIMLYKPSMISGHSDIIHNIYPFVNSFYEEKFGYVLAQKYSNEISNVVVPELAKEQDMEEIANLICSDIGIGKHYNPDELKNQFIERYNNKMGRNYIIRRNNKIVAHLATYAEAPNVAVIGGLIVSPEFRGLGYAKILKTYLYNLLILEGKKVFLFCHDEEVLKIHLKCGGEICSEYGKLTLINK
jgi:uncharacterized protein